MSIQTAELRFYRSTTVTDGDLNGGRMGSAQIADSVKNNIFPDPTQNEREAGLTRYRKVFVNVENADNLALSNARLHLTRQTNGEDRVTLLPGTQRDIQAELSGPREYGCGALKADAPAGASSFTVELETAGDLIRNGDTVWIGDGSNEEYFSGVTASRADTEITVTLADGDQLANAYAAANASAAAVFSPGDLAAVGDGWTIDSAAGTYDAAGSPLQLGNLGTVEDDWTLTFTDSTAFTVSGAYTGDLASGHIGADYAPGNAAMDAAYFTLPMAGWSGSWQSGDTMSFSTHPAAAAIWLKQVVPAGTAANGAVSFGIRITGESA